MPRILKCATLLLGLFISSTVNAIFIGDFPGLSKLIDMADAIVILRVERRLSDYNVPPYYSIHECMVYQSLKGDIPAYETSNSRIQLRLIDPEFNFTTPFAHGSSHLMFFSKKTAETGHEEGYYTLNMKGAYVPLSPLGNEKMPEGDTLEEKVRNVIKGAIEYENKQHEKKQTFLRSMLDIPKMQTGAIEQWGVNNDLPEGVIDIRDQLLSKADDQIRTGLLTQFVEKYPQIRKARDFESTVSRQSEKGRISIFFRHIHLGKAKTTDDLVPEKEQFSVLVILQEPPNNSAMSMGPIYPNLGLVGQIHTMAGDKELEAGLKKLVDDALKPLAEFNDSLNEEPNNQGAQSISEKRAVGRDLTTNDDFSCTLSTSKQQCTIGDPILVKIRLANHMDCDVIARDCDQHYQFYSFEVVGPDSETLPLNENIPRSFTKYNPKDHIIKPGQNYDVEIDITDWYDISKLGLYSIQAKWCCYAKRAPYERISNLISIKVISKK